jgi:hypothetical protein
MRPEDRGRIVAHLLAGAWRRNPPPIDLPPEDLEAVSPVLVRQSSAGLVWRRIRESGLEELPGTDALRETYRHHTLQVRLLERQLRAVVTYLRGRGVEPLLAKGWAMGRLYPEAGLRPYGDLDLMVLPSDYQTARAALLAPSAPEGPVELHEGFPMLRDRRVDRIFERSVLASLEGVRIRILGPEDELRLVTLHGFSHGLCRPLWLCDVAALLETIPDRSFDWEYAMGGDPWLSEGVRCSLGLTAILLRLDLKALGVPREWVDPPLPSWLVPATLRAFGARAHYMDIEDPGELLLRPGFLLKAAALRWANPLEVTFRRGAPWDSGAGLGLRMLDYMLRGGGFIRRFPENLAASWKSGRGEGYG